MNKERNKKVLLLAQVKQIIKDKDWYSLTESGSFKWKKSVSLMSQLLSEIVVLSAEKIRKIIESSFDEESLSRLGDQFFIDLLLEIDPELIIWTEGDPDWQKVKTKKTGLDKKAKIEFSSKNKIEKLKEIIATIEAELDDEIEIVVIDDKEKNLTGALALAKDLSEKISISTYLLDLRSKKENPRACLEFLSSLRDKKVRIIVDMDGVLVDTDRVLSETVAQKITNII